MVPGLRSRGCPTSGARPVLEAEAGALAGQSEWRPRTNRRGPIEILAGQGTTGLPELVQGRCGRMKTDPFEFLHAAGAVMVCGLASAGTTGLRLQSAAIVK